jgi:hypothetical protein
VSTAEAVGSAVGPRRRDMEEWYDHHPLSGFNAHRTD